MTWTRQGWVGVIHPHISSNDLTNKLNPFMRMEETDGGFRSWWKRRHTAYADVKEVSQFMHINATGALNIRAVSVLVRLQKIRPRSSRFKSGPYGTQWSAGGLQPRKRLHYCPVNHGMQS